MIDRDNWQTAISIPDLAVIPHIRTMKLQLVCDAKFLKHSFHKVYDFIPAVTITIGHLVKWALIARQRPVPTSLTRTKGPLNDPTECSPISIGEEIIRGGLTADNGSLPFQLHHLNSQICVS